MSCTITTILPGLTADLAADLDRRADLAGAPLKRTRRSVAVELIDLREDPSIASESLDFPHGWPHSTEVRDWLVGAMRFLGDNTPQGRFSFHAGWTEHASPAAVELDLEAFLARIAGGGLRSSERYEVSVR